MDKSMNNPTAADWLHSLAGCLEQVGTKIDDRVATTTEAYAAVARLLEEVRSRAGAVWWVGNGGSASICSHLAQDVMNKLAIRSTALSDASLLTCMANDFGYSQIYAQPLRQMAKTGDLLIAISSSGNSENILNCATLAHELQLGLVTLSGFSEENRLWDMKADVAFHVKHDWYGIVEVAHLAVLHSVIEVMYLRSVGPGAHGD